MAGSIDALSSQLLSSQVTNNKSSSGDKLKTTLEGNLTNASDDELMGVCREFESYFLEQMFKSMEKMVPKNESESSYASSISDYYKEDLMQRYSSMAVDSGRGIGLAEQLYQQMKRNYDI